MNSLSIDYLFNRIYDVLLWIKYVWLFDILRIDPQNYLDEHANRTWDGLRDRGWFDDYLAAKNMTMPQVDVHLSLWQRVLEKFGYKLPDSDGDGIPDVIDSSPYDSHNLSAAQLKERYQEDYTFWDNVRDIFGIGPKDSDGDGVPDSYELSHGMDPNNPDSDRDGLSDGQELVMGTDPLNNDTDHDGVLDGRDEAPLDGTISSIGPDSDGDGVSDKIEKILGTDVLKKDTDGDGIPDSMDTYPIDPNNISQVSLFDFSKHTDGVIFSIQNPVLAFFASLLSILAILVIMVLVYASVRWFVSFLQSLDHYDHHFYDEHEKNTDLHKIEDKRDVFMEVPNLPVSGIETPTTPPAEEEYVKHPRFAIIEGYLSSPSEALWRIGLLEADNMLLDVLVEKGYQGTNVAELLKDAHFKTVGLAWDAHNIRNRIAHDGSNFVLTEREAKRAFTSYESVFKELKVIR